MFVRWISVAVFLFTIWNPISAQVSPPSRAPSDSRSTIQHELALELQFNDETALGGILYRYVVLPEHSIGIHTAFSARFQNERVRDEIRPGVFLERDEERFLARVGVDKDLLLNRALGVSLGMGAGYSWGTFAGSNASPTSGWTFIPSAAALLRIDVDGYLVIFRLGYQRADLTRGHVNWVYLGLGGGL